MVRFLAHVIELLGRAITSSAGPQEDARMFMSESPLESLWHTIASSSTNLAVTVTSRVELRRFGSQLRRMTGEEAV